MSVPHVYRADHEKKLKNLKKGEWLNSTDCDLTNDIQELLSPHFDFEKKAPLAFVLAICVIKINIVLELEDNASKFSKLVEKLDQADTQSISWQLRRSHMLMESIELFAIGNPKKHGLKLRDQKVQMKSLLVALHKRNPTLLPALVDPKPLLDKGLFEDNMIDNEEVPDPGTPNEAADIVTYMWKYFNRLPASRQRLIDFLYPNHAANLPFPPYLTS